MNSRIMNKKGGTIILMTFLMLISILTVGIGVSTLTINEVKMGGNQNRSTKAYFAAEAGVERILWEIIVNKSSPWLCDPATTQFIGFNIPPAKTTCNAGAQTEILTASGAEYDVVYWSDNPSRIIRSEGRFSDTALVGTRRVIEIEFP